MSGLARAIKAKVEQKLERKLRPTSLKFNDLVTVKVTVTIPKKMPDGKEVLEERVVQMEGLLFGRNGDTIYINHPRPKDPQELYYFEHLPNYRGGPGVARTYHISDIVCP